VSRIALSDFNGVSAIDSIRVAGDVYAACIAVDEYGVASVLGGECGSCSVEHIRVVFRSNENSLIRIVPLTRVCFCAAKRESPEFEPSQTFQRLFPASHDRARIVSDCRMATDAAHL